MHSGSYTNGPAININKQVYVNGESPFTTFFYGTAPNEVIRIGDDNVILSNITMVNNHYNPSLTQEGVCLNVDWNNFYVYNCIFDQFYVGVDIESWSHYVYVHDCNFSNCIYDGAGGLLAGSVDNCYFWNNNFMCTNGIGGVNGWDLSYAPPPPTDGNFLDNGSVGNYWDDCLGCGSYMWGPGGPDYGGATDHYPLSSPNPWWTLLGGGETNTPPDEPTDPVPANNTASIDVYNMTLNCSVSDPDDDVMYVSFYWGNDTLIGTIADVDSGTDASLFLPDYWNRTIVIDEIEYNVTWLLSDTTYYWYVIADDGTETTQSPIWNFHTVESYDLNGESRVNYLDLSLFVYNYGERVFPPGAEPWDINEDTFTNFLDLSSLLSHYGK